MGVSLAETITEHKPDSVDSLKEIKINDSKVSELISDAVLQLGENLNIGQFKILTTAGKFSKYEHTNGKIGVIVEFTDSIDAEVGRCSDAGGGNEPYVSQDQVPSSDLDNESEILRKQALAEGKPEQVIEKIIQGRLSKFYKEIA